MKRRDFLVNSIVTLGASILLTGCNHEKSKSGHINRRKYKNISLPLLALGCMRLPNKNWQIEQDRVEQMVDFAMERGVNYFDTAYMYLAGKSENSIGKALKKYDRKSFFLADKSPITMLNSEEDIFTIFNDQLKKCQVDYFDFYMAHNICNDSVDKFREYKLYDNLLKLKKEGKITYLGFSFHGDLDLFKTIIKEYSWDFCQLQLNYVDWKALEIEKMYEFAKKHGVKVIVMEPLQGGNLCKFWNPEPEMILKSKCPNETPTSYALKWVANKKEVITILSGMSNLEQLEQNIATLSDYTPLTNEQENLANYLRESLQFPGEIKCTVCRYCMGCCPRGVSMSKIFPIYNVYKRMNNKKFFINEINALPESEKPSNCINCGLCKSHCPQGLDIPALLTKINDEIKQLTK